MKKKISLKYTSRDFNSIKQELIDYAKRYYSTTYKDFSETSFGSLMLDLTAYVGDVLSFATDYAANESFLDTALEYNNIIKHGKVLGYKFEGNPSSTGIVTCYITAPAKSIGLGPDPDYLPTLMKGTEFASTSGNNFILNENIDFSNSNNEVVVAQVNDSNGVPTHYAIKTQGQVISGELVYETIEVGEFSKFLKIEIAGENVTEIVSVTDSEGHSYYQVNYLSQDVIYVAIKNKGQDVDTVTDIIKPIIVPRRFIVEQEKNRTYIQFGYGSIEEIKINSIADPSSVVLKVHGKDHYTDDSFDPQNLVASDKFGVGPSNTSLTIVYRKNSSENVNAAQGTVNEIVNPIFEFDNLANLNATLVSNVIGSLEIANESPIIGDVSLPDSQEVKRRIFDVFASQNRAVTKNDYSSLIYQMPPRFGSIKRCSISQDHNSFKRNLNLYVISENVDGTLVATNETIKQNLKTWISSKKMINDSIDILDAKIINIGIYFEAIANDEKNKYNTLNQGITLLKNYYQNAMDIGENFSISNVYSILKMANAIVDVVNVEIVVKNSGQYSDTRFDILSYMSPDGREIYCKNDCIFEIKYSSIDIRGSVK